MDRRAIWAIGVATLSFPAGAALALQGPPGGEPGKIARVREVQDTVVLQRAGAANRVRAEVNTPLRAGDRVATASRSAAGIRFPDNSILRMGELSDVVVTSGDQRATRILRGQVHVSFKRPGTLSGAYAVAAVRGTHVLYVIDEANKRALVRCYDGRVFVGSMDNPVEAGTAAAVEGNSVTDPTLAGSEFEWQDGEIRFVDGPYAGQRRPVTGFDRAAGRVTFGGPPLAQGPGAGEPTGFVLVKRPQRTIVELRNNQGTTIGAGLDPVPPYRVASESFAMGQRQPFFRNLAEGRAITVYPGSAQHQTIQEQNFGGRSAVDTGAIKRLQPPLGGGGGGESPPPPPPPDEDCFFDEDPITERGGRLLRALRPERFAFQAGTPERREGGGTPSPPTQEDLYLPKMALAAPAEHDTSNFLFEPFGVVSNAADIFGTRLRYQATQGQFYGEIGYRYARIDSDDTHVLSEAFLQYRSKAGDVIAGRQHLFFRLANNTNIGNLLGLESADAVIYEAPLKGGFRQAIGYLIETDPLRTDGFIGTPIGSFSGWFARGQAPLFRGTVGYTLLTANQAGAELGYSFDFAQSVIPRVLDIYGEAGRDPQKRGVYTAGLYLPAIYRKTGFDVFLEWAKRESLDERVSLRIRREVAKNFLAVLFLDNPFGAEVVGGAGFVYAIRFR